MLLPELGLGTQVPVSVGAVFVDKRPESFIGPGFLNYILPKGFEVLEGPFEGGEGGDHVHKRTKSEPVDAFRPEQQNSGDRGFMFSDFVLLIRSRGRPGRNGGAILAGLYVLGKQLRRNDS